jgi:hypothetical protein
VKLRPIRERSGTILSNTNSLKHLTKYRNFVHLNISGTSCLIMICRSHQTKRDWCIQQEVYFSLMLLWVCLHRASFTNFLIILLIRLIFFKLSCKQTTFSPRHTHTNADENITSWRNFFPFINFSSSVLCRHSMPRNIRPA